MTYNPFGNYKSPSLTAAKTNDDGSYFKITYQSKKQATTKADSKGIDIKILYLPSFTSVTRTDWKDDVKLIMKNSLKFDVPYFNMGAVMINAAPHFSGCVTIVMLTNYIFSFLKYLIQSLTMLQNASPN